MNRNTDFIPFALPDIGREEEEAVIRVLRSGWLTTGKEAKAFEEEFGRFVGSPHALAVNSATSGLHLALEALGVGPGDRVITTPYTFTASAEVVRYLGAEPEFVDIERESFAVDPAGIERALAERAGKGRAAAIMPVHIAGEVRGMDRILSIAERHRLPVVEDAAHAFPSKTAAGYAGTLGRIGVYSFYATKTITTGEGGMIVTEDEGLSRRMGIMRLHGIDREIWNRYTAKDASWRYGVVEAGYKYNMTDLSAALGRVQLKRAENFLERRTAIAQTYREAFRDRDYLVLPAESEGHAWHLFLLRIDETKLTINRDEYIEELRKLGIGTSVHFIPLHLHPYWRDRYGLKKDDFPESVRKYTGVLSLPIYPGLTAAQVERIIQAVLSLGDSRYRKT